MTDAPRKAALQDLLAKVGAGELHKENYGGMPMMTELHDGVRPHGGIAGFSDGAAMGAYDGSLDAAMALHNAVLPGWHIIIWGHSNFGAEVSDPAKRHLKFGVTGDNPARAWLIAILKALIAQEAD